MVIRSSFILACGLFLTACETGNISSAALIRPSYSGAVTIIDQPITIKVAPLNRKVAFSVHIVERITWGSKRQQGQTLAKGTVESYQFGNGIEITYTFDGLGNGSELQSMLPFVMKIEVDSNGKATDLKFAGKIFDQANPTERESLRSIAKSFAQYSVPNTLDQSVSQGDVVVSFRMIDFLEKLLAEAKSEKSKTSLETFTSAGSGIVARLAGKVAIDGRPAYLTVWDGNETLSDNRSSITVTMGGYSLIDATTGIYSTYEILSQVSGKLKGKRIVMHEFRHFRLAF